MRKIVCLLPLLLAGCASVYTPQPITVSDPAAYAADLKLCQAAAAAYKPSLGLTSIGVATVDGATQNASNAVINPLVPVVGAAGGAVGSLASALGLMGHARQNVAKHCLQDKMRRDHAAIVANPDD